LRRATSLQLLAFAVAFASVNARAAEVEEPAQPPAPPSDDNTVEVEPAPTDDGLEEAAPDAVSGDDTSSDLAAQPSAAAPAEDEVSEAGAEDIEAEKPKEIQLRQVTPAEAPTPNLDAVWKKARREGVSWDLQAEIGGPLFGTAWRRDSFEGYFENLGDVVTFKDERFHAFVRLRAGFLVLKEPYYFSAGPTVTYGGFGTWAFGAQADLTSIWGGVWGQGEIAYSVDHGLRLAIGGGYRIFGGEVQVSDGGHEVALVVKIRIPLGLIIFTRGILDQKPAAPLPPG